MKYDPKRRRLETELANSQSEVDWCEKNIKSLEKKIHRLNVRLNHAANTCVDLKNELRTLERPK